LKLEEEGILGEGLFFNMSEKAAAASAPQNINNFYGPVQNPQIQQGNNSAHQTSSSIDSEILSALMQKLSDSLRDLNLNQDDQSEIIADVETVRTQLASPRPKNAIIGSCISSIRSILEKAGGSAAESFG
jgi:truncated hemoglobin YjbI